MKNMTFLPILLASFLGSAHCVGMCGGFVTLCSGTPGAKTIHQLFYHLGRLLTYLIAGAVAGFVSQGIDRSGNFFNLTRVSSYIIGGVLILLGLSGLTNRLLPTSKTFTSVKQIIVKSSMKITASIPRTASFRSFSIGLISTLLPCGWLYTFILVAMGTGAPIKGASIMFVFWLGTIPALFFWGIGSQKILQKVGQFFPKIQALTLILAGIISIYSHVKLVSNISFEEGSSKDTYTCH